ncbi:MAG: Na+/H+ antiporter [Chthoniobacter sp.]|uniref:Na+/H+ antiporter n=1 Tax=Chthoniobacter sp. TaxID=2510640 RepID=UPI0032A5AC2B
MAQLELVCFVLMLVAALDIAARKIHLPYPVLMVLCGLTLGLIPRLPQIAFAPELVLPVFLPPLLFPTALLTSWHDFKTNLRPILLLAVGLVLLTIAAVAWVAHACIPGLPWAAAFVLGAIVSPPDAIAATAVFERLEVPRRIVTILEGESLVNDAVALVAYRFGIAAVVTGTFSSATAALELPLVALGGAIIGWIVGVSVDWIQRRLDDPPVQITISLLAPYLAYLAAEHLECSGALAIVTAGVYLGWRLPRMISARTRLELTSFWQMLVYLLNGVVFIFIGLQLPQVVHGLEQQSSWSRLLFQAGAVSAVVIVLRLLWVFPAAYVPRFLFPSIRARDPYPDWRDITIIGWSGMRGVDSLATALALPLATAVGTPFPGRDIIIFVSFAVILLTLVAQGLSLPILIRILKVEGDCKTEEEGYIARLAANQAALAYLERRAATEVESRPQLNLLQAEYHERMAQLEHEEDEASANATVPDGPAASPARFHQAARDALQVERDTIIELRNQHRINDETLRIVQRDIDLADARLSEREA